MAGTSTSALTNGQSQVLTPAAVLTQFTMSYDCSVASDAAANAWCEGSVDGGTTFFPLTPVNSSPPSASVTGTGVRFYTGQSVNAVRVTVRCTSPNTVTATID